MSNYSPFKAAIAQLHTPEAIAYYKLRSQQDAQTLVIAAVATGTALYEAAIFTYNFGCFVRAWYESTKPQPEMTAIVPTQSAVIEVFTIDYDFDNTDEVIDGEIIEDAHLLFLSAAPQITVTPQSTLNQAWIASNITPFTPIKALPAAKSKKKPTTPKSKPALKARRIPATA